METITINVAILKGFYFFGWSYHDFIRILDDYQWQKNDKTYVFKVAELGWDETIEGLNNDDYDVIIFPYADNYLLFFKALMRPHSARQWKHAIREFIANGGGAVAHCAGVILFCDLMKSPETFSEFMISRQLATIPVSNTAMLWNVAIPPYDQFLGKLGVGESAYVYYSGMDMTDSHELGGGFPLDTVVDEEHPVFREYAASLCSVRWIGGPALLPKGENTSVLLRYPSSEELKSFAVHKWRFTGWRSFFKEVMKRLPRLLGDGKNEALLRLTQCAWRLPAWEKTEETVSLEHLAELPAMTAESFGDGRILLCALHSEKGVWNTADGRFCEVSDGKKSLLEQLHYWEGITRDDVSYATDWMVRREVAWASHIVADDELPPVK